MLRIDRDEKRLTTLAQKDLKEANLLERADVQRMIVQSPEAFFEEMGETLLLLGEEIRPATFVDDRIDVLALDADGTVVVIELKRSNNKLHLLQALSYAAMIANWEGDLVVAERARLTGRDVQEAEEEIEQFLTEDTSSLNDAQRVVLVSGEFDYEVLVTAEWLSEQYGVDIRCFRLVLSADGPNEYLSCTCIYPPPEITQHARRRGRKGDTKPVRYADWEEALAMVGDKGVADFFRSELAAKRENYLPKRLLRYRVDGRRRFFVAARRGPAYVWQSGRFVDDESFWAERIGGHAKVQPVKEGRCLRFYLSTREDLDRFAAAVRDDLPGRTFTDGDEAADDGEPG